MEPDAISRLERWIADAGGATKVSCSEPSRMSGGAIQENLAADLEIIGGDHAGSLAVVIRMDAPSGIAESHPRHHEFRILKAAFDGGVMVPEPLWLCEDASILGSPFFVMRRKGGQAAGHKLVKDDAVRTRAAELTRELGIQMARIHAIRPDTADLGFLPQPGEHVAQALIAGLRDRLDAVSEPQPALEWGLRWLEINAPPPREVVLCHNDFRTGNYLVDRGELTAILDWEFAAWGDRYADIGWFTARCWRFGKDDAVAGGVGELDDFLAGYQSEAGLEVDREQIPYWNVMATMRWAIIALEQGERFLTGGQGSLELALTPHIVPELEWDILTGTPPRP